MNKVNITLITPTNEKNHLAEHFSNFSKVAEHFFHLLQKVAEIKKRRCRASSFIKKVAELRIY